MIRFILLTIVPLFLFSAGNKERPVHANDIKGLWFTNEKEALVEVYENNLQYYGKVLSLAQPFDKKGHPKKDHRNKDPRLKERSLIGINTLYDLKYNAARQQWEGKVYIPLTGMEVDAVITLEDHNTMHIRGSFGGVRKTQVWVRVNKS